MRSHARILVVAATARELAASGGWHAVQCGVGPIEAALTTAEAISAFHPAAVLHVGIAGARRHANLAAASLVIGSEARFTDLVVPAEWAPSSVLASPELLAAVQHVVPGAVTRPIGTSGRVGGTSGCEVEAMEGFGVLRAAQRAGVPAIEVRAISNEIEELDRSRWYFEAAFAAITSATPALIEAVVAVLDREVA